MKKKITITLDEQILAQTQEHAKEDRRSLSAMIEFILSKFFAPKKPAKKKS